MKRLLLFLSFLLAFKSQAQTTYYWKGATGAATGPTDWQVASNWNTAADGTGSPRTTPAATDILIFDGAATATTTSYVGNVPTETIGTLKLTNNANVNMMTIVTPTIVNNGITSVTGYAGVTYTIAGSGFSSNLKKGDFIFTTQAANVQVLGIKDDNTITTSSDNSIAASTSYNKYTTLYPSVLTIDAGSTLNMAGAVSGTSFNSFAIITEGGTIAGSVNFPSRASYCKLYCTTPGGLHFLSGGTLTYNTHTVGQKNYLLGHTLGLYDSNGIFIYNDGSGANNRIPGYTGNAGIVFDSGSTFTNTAGNQYFIMGNSWQANGTDLVFTPGVYFARGSNYVANGAPVYTPYWPVALTSGLTLGNVEFRTYLPNSNANNQTAATLNATVDNLSIAGTTPASSISGNVFVRGNITNSSTNATSAAMTFNNVFLTGTSNQTITASTGSLTFTNLVIADKAIATLGSDISATNLSIVGKLNFGAFKVNGTGTLSTYAGPYSKATLATGFTKGSAAIGGINSNGAGTNTYEYPIGATVVNSGYIPAGTIYSAYSGSGVGVMSDFAKASVDVSVNETATFSIDGSSFTTSSADLATSAPGFATYLTDINATVLPLDLLSFGGSAELNGARLSWITTNEVNVNRFVIERRNPDGSFSQISEVPAKASSGLNNYTVTDAHPSAGINYYRLKMVDNDGSVKFSNVIGVNVSLIVQTTHSLRIYPSPAVEVINISHPAATKGAVLKIISTDGRIASVSAVDLGEASSSVEVSSLASGIYVVHFVNGKEVQTAKFVKK